MSINFQRTPDTTKIPIFVTQRVEKKNKWWQMPAVALSTFILGWVLSKK
ncbi:MAG: hypothetical protein ACUVQ1_08550 [Candidatus Kapaibacteriales bacterium]